VHELDHAIDASIDHDLDHDLGGDIDSDLEASLDTDLHGDFDSHLELDPDADLDGDFDHDLDGFHDGDVDHELHGETHVELQQSEIGIDNESYTEESRYLMGNIAIFLLIWGQIGWLSMNNLTDLSILIALIGGYLSSRAFAWFIANYAKTVINPIRLISRGDIGVVIYGVTPYKPGMVHVKRKDGVISTIIARGAYPHDTFEKDEKGYIWSDEGGIYTITKGVRGQPDLKIKKKNKLKQF
ncbi:MAG: hypothetical protein ACXAD7_27040, partial [Candidatus Kariarchaeaceae archaeon]